MDSIFGFDIYDDSIRNSSQETEFEIRAKEQAYIDEIYQKVVVLEAFEIANQRYL